MYCPIKKEIKKYFFIIFCMFFLAPQLNAAEENKIYLTSSDIKKLNKAEDMFQKGSILMQEADQMYLEMSNVQSELSTSDIEKINEKIIKKQLEASKSFEKSNKIRYEVYQTKINEFNSKYKGSPDEIGYAKTLEEQGRMGFQSAKAQRDDASSSNNNLEKYAKVSSAYDQENTAIDNLKKAFEIYSSIPFTGTVAYIETSPIKTDSIISPIAKDTITIPLNSNVEISPITNDSIPQVQASTFDNTSQTSTLPFTEPVTTPVIPTTTSVSSGKSIYETVQVNEKMIDLFNRFMSEEYPKDYENYMLNTDNLNFSDIESIKEAWYKFQYGNQGSTLLIESHDSIPKTDSVTIIANTKLEDSTQLALNTLEQTKDVQEKKPKTAKKARKQNAVKGSKAKIDMSKNEPESNITQSSYTNELTTEGFTYQIQIAASIVPLSDEDLSKIYSGNEQPTESKENGWYKYSIGNYYSFQAANENLSQLNVNGAFVVAFVNGKKINKTRKLAYTESSKNESTEGEIEFRVQIAASKVILSDEILKTIYAGSEELIMTEEDGWYKYSLYAGNNYEQAWEKAKSTGIRGAFINAYKNGNKINFK